MLETRIAQIRTKTPEWLALIPDPDAPNRYHGRYLVMDETPYGLGKLLGQGDEAFVFELINLRDGGRTQVVKICRHPPGSAKYAAWAIPYRLELNPRSVMPDIEMYPARLVRVPGGLVKVQSYFPSGSEDDLTIEDNLALIATLTQNDEIEAALGLAQDLIGQFGPQARLLEVKGRLLASLARWEEARVVLEEALTKRVQRQDYERFNNALLLAAVYRQIYEEGPDPGQQVSLTLEDGTVLTQTLFMEPEAAAADDTAQDREMYILLEIMADEPYFIPALLALAEALLESPGTAIFVPQVIEAIEQIDPGSPEAAQLNDYLHARYGEGTSSFLKETTSSDKDVDQGAIPAQFNQLLEDFNDAYRPEPVEAQLARARYQSALSHIDEGNPKRAEQAVREAIALDGEVIDYFFLLAELLDYQGHSQKALQVLQQTARNFSDQAAAHERLGDYYQALEAFDEARLSYLRALHSDPEAPWRIKLALGWISREQKNRQEAVQWFHEAFEDTPLEPDVVLGLVYALADREGGATDEEFQEACDLISTAVEQQPKIATLWVCQAQLQARTGYFEEAIDSLKIATNLDPDHPFAADFLNELLEWRDLDD